jgi:hypothetical protein
MSNTKKITVICTKEIWGHPTIVFFKKFKIYNGYFHPTESIIYLEDKTFLDNSIPDKYKFFDLNHLKENFVIAEIE